MKIRITPPGHMVGMSYDTEEAHLTIVCAGKVAVYDEDECDKLLRLTELSGNPREDLAEFFYDEFGRVSYQVATQYRENAAAIGRQVYA